MENWTDKEIGNINSLIQTASSENIKISMEILQNSPELFEELIIENFGSYEAIDLSSWQLTELPACIGKLDKLQYLDLCRNQLTEIPEGLLNGCVSLVWLDITHNNIPYATIERLCAELPNCTIFY